MTKVCRECGEDYRGYKCKCGFKEDYQSKDHHPDALKCCWMINGKRCRNIGTIATNPHEGSLEGGRKPEDRKFYCPWHYEVLLDQGFERDREAVERFWDRYYKRQPKPIPTQTIKEEIVEEENFPF